jgi:hypothetical protein
MAHRLLWPRPEEATVKSILLLATIVLGCVPPEDEDLGPVGELQEALVSCCGQSCGPAGACFTFECNGCLCDLVPKPAGSICRPAAGPCDKSDTCNGSGTCGADAKKPLGTVCRAATGECDQAETCTGQSNNCPGDVVKPAGSACRVPAICENAGVCNGISTYCPGYPPRLKVGTLCRARAGECDAADYCNGMSADCPDRKQTAGTSCGEDSFCFYNFCDGTSNACQSHPRPIQCCYDGTC